MYGECSCCGLLPRPTSPARGKISPPYFPSPGKSFPIAGKSPPYMGNGPFEGYFPALLPRPGEIFPNRGEITPMALLRATSPPYFPSPGKSFPALLPQPGEIFPRPTSPARGNLSQSRGNRPHTWGMALLRAASPPYFPGPGKSFPIAGKSSHIHGECPF